MNHFHALLTCLDFVCRRWFCGLPGSFKHAYGKNSRDSAANDLSDSEDDKQLESPIESHLKFLGMDILIFVKWLDFRCPSRGAANWSFSRSGLLHSSFLGMSRVKFDPLHLFFSHYYPTRLLTAKSITY